MIATENKCVKDGFLSGMFASILILSICLAMPCLVFAVSSSQDESDLAGEVIAAEPKTAQITLTEEERGWLKDHPDIVLGYTDSFEPEVIVNSDGTYRGILVDFLDELNARLGTRIRLQIEPVPELIEKAKKKEVDGILSLHPEYADKLGLLKTDCYQTNYAAVFSRKGDSFNRPTDLADKKVAIVDKVFFSEQIVEEYGEGATVLKVLNCEEGLRLVSKGEADYFIAASFNAYLITKYQLFDLVTQYVFYDHPINAVIGTRPDWPEFVSILNKGISHFSKEEMNAISAKWINPPQQEKQIELTPEEQAWIAKKHTVRVRIVNFPPYTILGQGKPTGIVPDYLKRITEQTGVEFELVEASSPYAEALRGLQNLEGPDVIPSMMFSPEERNVLFSNPYQASPVVFYTRTDADFITSISDLIGKRVIVNKGTVIEQALAREYPAVNLVYCRSAEQGLHMLAEGTADAFVGNLTVTSFLIQKHGLTNVRVAAPSPMPLHEMSFGVRKDWPELTGIINKVLDGITVEERSAMQGKYLSVRYEHGIRSGDVVKWGGGVVGSAILIILLFVGWNRFLHKKVKERTSTLAESEDRLRLATAAARVAIWDFDPRSNAVFLSPEWKQQLGYEDDELESRIEEWESRLHPDEREEALDMVEDYLAGRIPEYAREFRLRHKDGSYRWVYTRGEKQLDDAGNPVRILGCHVDITERKQSQAFLEESESRFRATFEQAAVGIAHVSPEGRFLRINRKFCEIVGYTHDEMLNLTYQEITHPDDLNEDVSHINELLAGEIDTYSMEKRYICKDGELVWIHLTVSLVRDETDQPQWFVGVVKDISERKQAEIALRENEQKFRDLIDQSPTVFELYDKEGVLMQVNPAFEKLWNLSGDDVVGKFNVFKSDQVKEKGLLPYLKRAFEGEFLTPPDIEFDASMEEVYNREKSRKRYLRSILYPVKNIDGNVTHVVMMHEDITEGKHAEEEIQRLQEEYTHIARVSAMGELSASLAHELKQPLAAIRSNAQAALRFLTGDKPDIDELHEVLKDIIADNRRADDVIGKLRKLMQKSQIQIIKLNMKELVQDILPLITNHEAMRKISLQLELDDTIPLVAGDRVQVQQVILNLILNSTEALMNTKSESRSIIVRTHQNDTQYITLSVEDNGPGIDAEVMPRLFEAFYTTKQDGLGMGLAICRSIIEEHGGRLWAENNPDGGATFYFTIPIAKENSA